MEILCPCLRKIQITRKYPVEAYCEAYPDGCLHIPSLAEYRLLCTSGDYQSCEWYCRRRRQEEAEDRPGWSLPPSSVGS